MKHRTELSAGITATRQGSIGWLMQRVARRFEATMTDALREEGLTLAQFAVLMCALEADGQTQTEIGAAFAMPAWQISRALDGLQKAGLIERRVCIQSRRVHRIHVTEAALSRVTQLRARVAAVNAQVLAPLEPEKRAILGALLRELVL